MTIRRYKPDDRQSCINIFKSNVPRFFATEELNSFESWLTGQDECRPAYAQTQAEYFYVAERNNKIVGCGGFYLFRNEPLVNLVWGMVDNSCHKQGIGKKILESRLNLIGNIYPGLNVSLDTTQHSYQFFEKLGFRLIKISENVYGKDLHRYDMIKDQKR